MSTKISGFGLDAPASGDLFVVARAGANLAVDWDSISGLFDPAGTAGAGDTAHVGDPDPHTQYLDNTRGDARYAPVAVDQLTLEGDLLIHDGAAYASLPIGAEGQELVVGSGRPAWATKVPVVRTHTAIAPTTGDTFATGGEIYNVDGSGITGTPAVVLPDSVAPGTEVEMFIGTACAAGTLMGLKTAAAGSTLDGIDISAAPSVSKALHLAGERLVLECKVNGGAGATEWVTATDGRQVHTGYMDRQLTPQAVAGGSSNARIEFDVVVYAHGVIGDVVTDFGFRPLRTGLYDIDTKIALESVPDGTTIVAVLFLNATAQLLPQHRTTMGILSGGESGRRTRVSLNAGDLVTLICVQTQAGFLNTGITPPERPFLAMTEVLPR